MAARPGGGPGAVDGTAGAGEGAELAIRAARQAGLAAGPGRPHRRSRATALPRVEPLLGGDVRYRGHLTHDELAVMLGRASVCLVTPRWDEPYGLVAAEALACGTPVCGFARGALPELLDDRCAVLVKPDDVGALAAGLPAAARLSRAAARAHAAACCSQEQMIAQYEDLYREVAA